jgi:DNA transformation protein and related proteins
VADDGFKDYVLDQLDGLQGVSARSMFGGNGIYLGHEFFGIVFDGRLYFRTNENTRVAYTEQGSEPFQPTPRQKLKNYYEVPADVIEDRERLAEWAREAVESRAAARR